jgi:AcrR family transcriptional regulator
MNRKVREELFRKSIILEEAELLFFEQGFDHTTMDQVAKKAELSKKTLYKFYHSKNQIRLEIVRKGFEIVNKMLKTSDEKQRNGLDRLITAVKKYKEFTEQFPNFHRFITLYQAMKDDFQDPDQITLNCYQEGDITLNHFQEIIEKGIEDGTISSEIKVKQTVLLIWSSFTGLSLLYQMKENFLTSRFETNINQAFDYMLEFIIKKVKNEV